MVGKKKAIGVIAMMQKSLVVPFTFAAFQTWSREPGCRGNVPLSLHNQAFPPCHLSWCLSFLPVGLEISKRYPDYKYVFKECEPNRISDQASHPHRRLSGSEAAGLECPMAKTIPLHV